MRLFSTIVACMLVAACGGANGPTVIDGSSQAAYEESLKQARRDVGPGDRIKLAAAITEFQAQMFAKADTGQLVVREAQACGYKVTALVRSPGNATGLEDARLVTGHGRDA